MNRVLAATIVFLTVISGVIARAQFNTDINIKNIFRFIDFTLLFVLFLSNINKIKIKKIDLFMLIYLIICLLLVFKEDLLNLIYIFLFVLTIGPIFNEEKLIKILLNSTIISLIIIFIFLVLGITEDSVWVQSNHGSYITHDLSVLNSKPTGYRVRYTFGMNHPNSFTVIIVSLISLLFLIRTNFLIFLLNMSLSYIVYYYTDSKNLILFTVCIYFLYILFKFVKPSRLIFWIPLILSFLSVFLPIFLSNSLVNGLLSNRLGLWHELFQSATPKDWILGKSIEQYVIDNGYIHLLFAGGLLLLVYFVKIIGKSLDIIIYNKNTKLLSFFIAFLFFNFVEEYLLRFENSATILFWVVIFASKLKDTNDFVVK